METFPFANGKGAGFLRVTLTQVAQRAGVSLASASRALNGESASARTVERVAQAAKDLAYVPDARAQSLKLGTTRQLSFAVADVGNHVYVEMLRAVEDAVREDGYRVLISSTGSAIAAEIELLQSLQRGYADGLIISPLRIDDDLLAELSGLRIPAVVIGNLPRDAQQDNVRANSAAGMQLAVRHLADLGRRRIGFINGPLDTTPGQVRGRAFWPPAGKRGWPPRPATESWPTTSPSKRGHRRRGRCSIAGEELDAVLAANDLIAAGVYHAAFDRGWQIPEQLAVVGMDDSALASQMHPTLTSVNLGSAARGRWAAELLLSRLRDPDRPIQRIVVEPELVVRRSTDGPAPQSPTRPSTMEARL